TDSRRLNALLQLGSRHSTHSSNGQMDAQRRDSIGVSRTIGNSGLVDSVPWMANRNYRYTPSILRMIRSAHWTALAINDSVLGLGRDSWRSSGFFRCLATRMPAT